MDEFQTDAVEAPQENMLTNEQDALRWLKQVDGTVYHNRNNADGENTWVAVVRTPAGNGTTGKIILAFGETIQEAASAAESEWNVLWSSLSVQH